jgi:hypothetical protein
VADVCNFLHNYGSAAPQREERGCGSPDALAKVCLMTSTWKEPPNYSGGLVFALSRGPERKRISAVPRLIVGFPIIMNIPSAWLKDCFTRIHPVWQPSCYNFGGKSTKSIEIVGRAGFAFYP